MARTKGSTSESFLFVYHNLADSQQREFCRVQDDVGYMKLTSCLYCIETLIMFQGCGILLDDDTFRHLRRMSGNEIPTDVWKEVTESMRKHGYLVEHEGRFWTIKALETLEAVVATRTKVRNRVDAHKERRAAEEFIKTNTLPEPVAEDTRLKLENLEKSGQLEVVMIGSKTGAQVKKDYDRALMCGFNNGTALGLAVNHDSLSLKEAEQAVKFRKKEDRIAAAIPILMKKGQGV